MSAVALSFAAALVLAGFHAFTPALLRLPSRHQGRLASFSGGAGLAYVFLYLLFELVRNGATEIHALAPVGPDPLETLFIVLLSALSATYVLQMHLQKTVDLRNDHRGYVALFLTYNVLVGAGLLEEARWGALNLAFYVAALGLHLLFNDVFLQHSFRHVHRGTWRAALASGPLVGCFVATALAVPEGVLYGLLAVIAGGTIVNVFRRELPEVQSFRPVAFIGGVAAYALLIFANWRF